jgi:archaetidylinositol phosphate synthase
MAGILKIRNMNLTRTKIKSRVKFLFEGSASALHRAGLNPNSVSALSLLSSLASAASYLYFREPYFLPPALLLLLGGFFDGVDGAMAEKYGQKTRFGALLDSTFDRISELAVLSAVIVANLCDLRWGLLAMATSMMVSYTRARAEGVGLDMMGRGIAERPERTIILALATALNSVWSEALPLGVVIIGILSTVTFIQRMSYARSSLR